MKVISRQWFSQLSNHRAPQNSPIFDGSPYSVSGNSVSITHGNGSSDWTSHGLGGECVKEGPFGNMTVKLGPVGAHNITVLGKQKLVAH